MSDLAALRLRSQRLLGDPCGSLADVVAWLTAVQSQDYAGAKWALAQRTAGTTEAEIDRLFDDGVILRTHVLRPTWHFVLPADCRWLLELTGPRARARAASRFRQFEIDDDLIARANEAMQAALTGGHSLVRRDLEQVLQASGIVTEG